MAVRLGVVLHRACSALALFIIFYWVYAVMVRPVADPFQITITTAAAAILAYGLGRGCRYVLAGR